MKKRFLPNYWSIVGCLMLIIGMQLPLQASTTRWGAEYFPDVPLTTHTGKQVRFFSDLLEDKVVAINFMFTSCQAVCPTETARLRQVQQLLGDRVGKDVHMYSISIDPTRDTTEALAEYAEKFNVGPGWTFLRASEKHVKLLQDKLGLLVDNKDDPLDHATSFVVGNQSTGRWTKRSPYEHPSILARLIGDEMHNFSKPTTLTLHNYADVKPVGTQSQGEYIFRTRCNACHSIDGSEDSLGPDLKGITKVRNRDWLARWIKEPDQVLASGDELAVALYKKYDGLTMPNLGLTDKDTFAVIDFIEAYKPE